MKRLPIYWAGIAAMVMTALLVGANVIGPTGSRRVDLLAGIAPALGFALGAVLTAIGKPDGAALDFYRDRKQGWLIGAFFLAVGVIGFAWAFLHR